MRVFRGDKMLLLGFFINAYYPVACRRIFVHRRSLDLCGCLFALRGHDCIKDLVFSVIQLVYPALLRIIPEVFAVYYYGKLFGTVHSRPTISVFYFHKRRNFFSVAVFKYTVFKLFHFFLLC